MAWRLSVRMRLLAVFGMAALFAVIASAMGLLAFGSVERAQKSFLESRLPTVELAQALAHRAQAVAAAAPQMVIASTQAERDSAGAQISTQIANLDRLLVALRPRVSDRSFLEQLEAQKADLTEALKALDHWVGRRIGLHRKLDERLSEARDRLNEARDLLANRLAKSSPAEGQPVRLAMALVSIERAATLLEALPLAAAGRLVRLESAFGAELTMAARDSEGDGSWEGASEVRGALAAAEALARGPDSLFATRDGLEEAERRCEALLVAYSQFANRLVYSADTLAAETAAVMNADGRSLTATLGFISLILLAIAALAVGGALVMALFADRTISGRLATLRQSMAAHVAGLDAPLPDLGRDEIGEMAQALKIFVATIADREGALKASQDYLRAVLDAVPEGILTIEDTGEVIGASRSAESLFGPGPSLIGKELSLLISDAQGNRLSLEGAERAGAPQAVIAHRADGHSFPGEITVAGILRDDRQIHVLSLRDISERQRIEAERQRFIALLAAAQEATADGLMVIDLDGAIITCNQKYYDTVGISPDAFASRSRGERLALLAGLMAEPQYFIDRIEEMEADPDLTAYDMLHLADGRLIERYSSPFKVGGILAGRLWSVRDITEREKARAELTEAKEAAERALSDLKDAQRNLVEAEKMAALGQLVAGIAHEINTPVGITVTAASFIADEAKAMRTLIDGGTLRRSRFAGFLEALRESSTLLLSNANRAAELIQSFKQVAVDQTSDERRTFDLAHYVAEVLISLGPSLRKLPHKVTVDIPPGVILDSYPGALAQILANVVLNALSHAFLPQRAGLITLTAHETGEGVVELRITDNGRGMSPEVRDQVFEPFFTTTRGAGGSGLGLHIAYNLANRTLGGRIGVDSAPGQGTTFIVTIPRVAPPAPQALRSSGTIILDQ
ncbi:histidine kinase [Rhodospirillum rubrum]|uniref:ATP-binding protein n=1 Tax=Rhodospirillum rubrum TaxID=1085 RepID=UPI00190616EC|nr:ATP-binding protein [Rhodospirillum rubrum]MBK1663401.1 histidine kinase [Rhodospirillum rubrum]MBK1675573.1 histidine kinase [Rhodospirillum rubrum]